MIWISSRSGDMFLSKEKMEAIKIISKNSSDGWEIVGITGDSGREYTLDIFGDYEEAKKYLASMIME